MEYLKMNCNCIYYRSNTTYESLGVKDMLNIYDGLDNPIGEYCIHDSVEIKYFISYLKCY